MSYFIDRIADYIHQEDLALEHLTIILPSQRAKKYLQRSLYNAYEKPIFSPEILTMNRWVQHLSPLPVIDQTRALFKLHEVHLTVDPTETQTLDEFLNWGKTLLSDFDEMDRYLIDSKDLFKNLADIKEIENWSFNTDEALTEGQKRFMRFWDLLPEYYKVFNERLQRDGECYMGQTYKSLAHHIDRAFEGDKQRQFIFAGFNALSPAEKSIMKQLEKMGRASIFIDADEYYLQNKDHEAGLFLRDLLKSLNTQSLPFTENQLSSASKSVNIINCAQRTGQAQVSATLLHQEIPNNELSDTLLVLADESMVVPVIKNIPASVEKTNITLGLPLKNTAIRSWVDLLFSVQEHHIHFQTDAVYHKDFIRFIKHPFIVAISSAVDRKIFQKIERRILENNWLFIALKKLNLSPLLEQIAGQFFGKWHFESAAHTLSVIRSVNRLIFDQIDREQDTIEKAILYHFDSALRQLDNIFEEFQPSLNLGTFKKLFNQHWVNATIAYYGNPLEGLQVMGVLETRLLDFKNVIVVGLNDGSMPPTNTIQTFVPMDLRKYHGLPTPREKQGLFAHHFYRLLHAAERVWITYSTAEGNMGVDEPSRYIQQVELELARINPNISLNREDYTLTNEEEQSEPLIIQKTPELLERIRTYLSKGTSASAIKTHLNCSLDFYYKYLLGFGEEGEVEEEIEASSFGSFIHDTLESVYTPHARIQKDKEGKIVETRSAKNLITSDVQKMITQFKPV
ncbi:MAG: PD-(D/E)XK nuclease family protein, partial [Bacteroidota bacterium]